VDTRALKSACLSMPPANRPPLPSREGLLHQAPPLAVEEKGIVSFMAGINSIEMQIRCFVVFELCSFNIYNVFAALAPLFHFLYPEIKPLSRMRKRQKKSPPVFGWTLRASFRMEPILPNEVHGGQDFCFCFRFCRSRGNKPGEEISSRRRRRTISSSCGDDKPLRMPSG